VVAILMTLGPDGALGVEKLVVCSLLQSNKQELERHIAVTSKKNKVLLSCVKNRLVISNSAIP